MVGVPVPRFVYIALPGETQLVTAGRFQRVLDRTGVATRRGGFGTGRAVCAGFDTAVLCSSIKFRPVAHTPGYST